MRSFTLQCTALNGSNKVGKLKPDDQGYYPVVLGGFDIPTQPVTYIHSRQRNSYSLNLLS